jgi:hypothetical protein
LTGSGPNSNAKQKSSSSLLAWVNGDSDALTVLQRTYMDPRTSTGDRIKAAGAAIGYRAIRHQLLASY